MKQLKRSAALILAVLTLCTLCACGSRKSSGSTLDEETYGAYQWPDSPLGQAVPEPESKVGWVAWEYSDSFYVEVAETSKEAYDAYVSTCRSAGFTEDYAKGDTYYWGYNEDGIYISLSWDEEDEVLSIMASEPDEEEEEEEAEEATQETPEAEEAEEAEDAAPAEETAAPEAEETPAQSEEEESPAQEDTEAEEETSGETDASGVTLSFKEYMDAYEEFMNEYADFMKRYLNSDDVLGMLSEYGSMMAKYAEFMEQIDEIDLDDLSAADYAYYLEVTARVTQVLLSIYE